MFWVSPGCGTLVNLDCIQVVHKRFKELVFHYINDSREFTINYSNEELLEQDFNDLKKKCLKVK
jgi:hypothetical protein